MNFKEMTKEEAIEYCYKHKNKYNYDIESEDGDEFECLIGSLEDGTIKPTDLPDYGMDYWYLNR